MFYFRPGLGEVAPLLDKVQTDLADVDGDGQVTIQDATAVQLFIAEYNDGCEKTGEPFLYYQS